MKTFKVKYKGETWEVEKEAKRIILKDLKIPRGYQLMPFDLVVYLYDNDLIKIHEEWELTEQFSKRNIKKGYKYSALYYSWYFCFRLYVDGYIWDGVDNGLAFGVRFCKKIKGEEK